MRPSGVAARLEDLGGAPHDLGVPRTRASAATARPWASPRTSAATPRRPRTRSSYARELGAHVGEAGVGQHRLDPRVGLEATSVGRAGRSANSSYRAVERRPGAVPRLEGRDADAPAGAEQGAPTGQRADRVVEEEDHQRRGDHVVRRRGRPRVGGVALGDVHVGEVRGVLGQSSRTMPGARSRASTRPVGPTASASGKVTAPRPAPMSSTFSPGSHLAAGPRGREPSPRRTARRSGRRRRRGCRTARRTA